MTAVRGIVRTLRIERPGTPSRGYYGYGYWAPSDAYQRWRDADMERIARLPHDTEGDAKPMTRHVGDLRAGQSFRRVDGHGRTFGPRLTTPSDLPATTRVRVVQAQPEDLRSAASRLLKRAHKAAMRED